MISFHVPQLYHSPMCWFAKEFLCNVDITIIVREINIGQALGYCTALEDEFLIEVNINQKDMEKITTFFHECYHILQHLDKQPRDEDECVTFESVLFDRWTQSSYTIFVKDEGLLSL